jgi:putative MATE family efflux protein
MNDLTEGKVGKLLFRFAVPIFIGNVFQQLYQIIDSIVVGHYIGKYALAAVGASFPIIFLVLSFVIGISISGTILASQYFGAKNYEGIRRTFDTLNIFLATSALVISIIAIIFSKSIFRILRMPEELIPMAESFFSIYMLGSVFMFGFSGTTAILRGMGDSRTPLIFLVFSTLLNTVLDLLFIIVFHWGIISVALATVISEAVSLVLLIIYLNRKHSVIKFSFSHMVFDRSIFKKTLKIGLPTGFQQTFIALGMLALMGIVNSFGTDVIAAYSVAWRVDSFASMPGTNLAVALSAFVGQNIGAQRPDRIKAGLKATLYMSTFVAVFISILTYFFGDYIIRIFTNDPKVIAIGYQYLRIVGVFYIVFNTMFIFAAVMRGAGDTFIPMIFSLISLWLIRVPFSYFLSRQYGEIGIWWSIPIGWMIGNILNYGYYRTGRWKRKAIVVPLQKENQGTGQ